MVRKTILDNGCRVITETLPHLVSVSLGIWVDNGSRDEGPDNSGISHFIEHMIFKGTSRRNAQQIALELDAVGGKSIEHLLHGALFFIGQRRIHQT